MILGMSPSPLMVAAPVAKPNLASHNLCILSVIPVYQKERPYDRLA